MAILGQSIFKTYLCQNRLSLNYSNRLLPQAACGLLLFC
nr:MAG TPA: hypothetical protein [Caudoviricetes sp.]